MSDTDAVRRANRGFYDAFESLDRERMAEVWLRSPRVQCTHPGWKRLSGVEAVLESWARIFENTMSMRFAIEDEEIAIMGDLAWIVCTEVIRSQTLDGPSLSRVEATNVFERHGDRWLLVHHNGSPLVARFDEDDDSDSSLH
ncbi:MAG: nuclear transport factor 2 family protein [Candidatus Binatia bacterium]